MDAKIELVRGENCFTVFDLLKKAARFAQLKLVDKKNSKFLTEPIKTYALDKNTLAFLAEKGIKEQKRPDCNNEIFTLIDQNPQNPRPGFQPSNSWNFKQRKDGNEFDLEITLYAKLVMNPKKRGIEIYPQVFGTFLSATDPLPVSRMFKALVDSDKAALIVAKELAAKNKLFVTWAQLGFAGIRLISDLFVELFGKNEAVMRLSHDQKIFKPTPFNSDESNLYLMESEHWKLFEIWVKQLEEYRLRLKIQ